MGSRRIEGLPNLPGMQYVDPTVSTKLQATATLDITRFILIYQIISKLSMTFFACI